MEIDTLLTEFQDVAQQLDVVLKDLEWRKPDVEHEEKKLRDLRKKALKDPGVDVASQAIVVRVGREILNDKIKEAKALEKRMKELQAHIEKATVAERARREGVPTGEAVSAEKAEAAEEKPEGGEKAGEETEAEEG